MKVLIISKIHFLREMLVKALGPEWDSIAVNDNNSESLDCSDTRPPDVAIVDSSHPDGFALVSALRSRFPDVSIVVLAVASQDDDFIAWAKIGISGYVEPDTSIEGLVSSIRRSAAGEVVCPPRMTALLLNRFGEYSNANPTKAGLHGLTGREREVLELLAEGLSNKLIARRLRIAEATVKNHVHSILEKWNLRSRGEAAACFRQSTQSATGSHFIGRAQNSGNVASGQVRRTAAAPAWKNAFLRSP